MSLGYVFLLEDRRPVDADWGSWPENRALILDAVSLIHHSLRLPIKEPARTKAALAHLEATIAHGKEMWTFILAERDDDHEWIPNPKQTGVLQVEVTQEIVDTWLATLEESDQLLQGKKLLPFWRGTEKRGVNLRRVFTEPRTFDVIEWIQGTGATPYLEDGTVTSFADPVAGQRMLQPFGGDVFRFVGFGFWFN